MDEVSVHTYCFVVCSIMYEHKYVDVFILNTNGLRKTSLQL